MAIRKREIGIIKDDIADVTFFCADCGGEIHCKGRMKKGSKTQLINGDIEGNRKYKRPNRLRVNEDPLAYDIKPVEVVFSSYDVCKDCYDKGMIEVEKQKPEMLEKAKVFRLEREKAEIKYAKEKILRLEEKVKDFLAYKERREKTLDGIYFKIFRKNGDIILVEDITSVKFVKGWINLETKSGEDYHFYNESYSTNYRIDDFKKKEKPSFRSVRFIDPDDLEKYSDLTIEYLEKLCPGVFEFDKHYRICTL